MGIIKIMFKFIFMVMLAVVSAGDLYAIPAPARELRSRYSGGSFRRTTIYYRSGYGGYRYGYSYLGYGLGFGGVYYLGGGAYAGIAIGVVIFIICICVCICLRRAGEGIDHSGEWSEEVVVEEVVEVGGPSKGVAMPDGYQPGMAPPSGPPGSMPPGAPPAYPPGYGPTAGMPAQGYP